MAIDFETIKKINVNVAEGHLNVGMIKDNAGRIIWRKKYDKLLIGLAAPSTGKWSVIAHYAPNNVMTGTSVAENNYFRYNDRVDIFEPVNLNAKLVVSWPIADYVQCQVKDISILESQAMTYTATSAVNFDYPVHTPGIARELGQVTYQSPGRFGDAADDTTACVYSFATMEPFHPESAWSEVLKGSTNLVRIQNRYLTIQSTSQTVPSSSTNYVKCTVNKKSNQVGHYFITFSLHYNRRASTEFAGVSFFVVDNKIAPSLTKAKLITLFPGDGDLQTIESAGLDLDILQVGTYINSSGSYVGSQHPIQTINTTSTVYLILSSGNGSHDFRMNVNGEIYNSNTNIATSYSYCNIVFSRPDAKYTRLRITYSQDSENNFDYGVFSEVDKQLCPGNVLDYTTTASTGKVTRKIYTGYGSEVVKHSCKGESGTKTVTYDISTLDPGTRHSICVKYIKDLSGNTGTDTFKITKIEFVEDVEYDFHYDAAASYYTLTVKNNSSKDVTLE